MFRCPLLGRRSLHFGGSEWIRWDETSEAGIASADTFVALLENTSAGGNETGQGGGLSGSDLVLSDIGSTDVGGATGTPPKRAFTSSNQYLQQTTTFNDNFFTNRGTFNLILKLNNASLSTSTDYITYIYNPTATRGFVVGMNTASGQKMYMEIYSANGHVTFQTTDSVPSTGDVYFAFMCGSSYMRAGFSTTKPTKWSDFESGKRASSATTWSNDASLSGYGGGGVPKWLIGNDAYSRITFNAYYVICSKKELIDPNN